MAEAAAAEDLMLCPTMLSEVPSRTRTVSGEVTEGPAPQALVKSARDGNSLSNRRLTPKKLYHIQKHRGSRSPNLNSRSADTRDQRTWDHNAHPSSHCSDEVAELEGNPRKGHSD